ncbi:MAG TPA: NUDIX hydrolase [Ramlibacter sp.]|uniref:NUDIX hydrolase n=1 Tax=Ramlibacter sp. TaxID=1917967 RepID=UPI002C6F7A46|nr:NUDIX hydrolase [Ramlibacter sp.]HVZ42915.1 NUDIX hydrolase [Ramlibacter sp.]
MSTEDPHLVEHTVATEELLKASFLHVVRDTVRLPNGRTSTREYILHPGAVMVIPLLDDGRIVLERQYRHPVKGVLVEFPAGKLDAGEDHLACAKRELLEETGYAAREWALAGALNLAVGYSDECIDIWFARGLTLTKPELDDGEFVEVILADPGDFLAWCRDGKVKDSKTLAGALWLQNVLSGAWNLHWRS